MPYPFTDKTKSLYRTMAGVARGIYYGIVKIWNYGNVALWKYQMPRQGVFSIVAVKSKPEGCGDQNRKGF
jgi:hypothetical protein